MVEVRVRHQNDIDGWKIADSKSGTAQALEHEEPAGKVGVDQHTAPAELHEKTGVADEGDAEFPIAGELWLMGLTAPRGDRGMPHQTSELGGSFA